MRETLTELSYSKGKYFGLPLPANAQIDDVHLAEAKFNSIDQILCRKPCMVHRFGTTKIPTKSDAFRIML